MKAVFISLAFPGVSQVGEHGAQLGLWEFVKLEGQRVAIPPADLYVLGAWHGAYSQVLTALAGERVGICWTSSAAEMELNAPIEFVYLKQALDNPRIAFVWFGDPGLAAAYPEKGFWHPYPLEFVPQPPADKRQILTLCCPDKPSKNIYAQLLAVAILQQGEPHLVLHTNIPDLRGLEGHLNVVQHGWLPRMEYDQLLASARLNLAASFSETCCYQAAESVLLGTPCLLSPAVPWAPKGTMVPSLTAELLDAAYLARHMDMLLEVPHQVLEEQREALERYAGSFHREEWQRLCLDVPRAQHL